MSRTLAAFTAAWIVGPGALLLACDAKRPTAPPATAPAPPTAAVPNLAPPVPALPATAPSPTIEAPQVVPVPEDGTQGTQPERVKVGEAECKKACDNALTLLKAGLPEGVSAEMRAAVEGKLTADCPRDCVARADQESVDCIIRARTTQELSSCPK